MDANSGCCCFGSRQRAAAWAAAFGLVQSIVLLPLSITALLKQLWNVDETSPSVPALLYIYYFYNPNGDIANEPNKLAFRTQILASIYTILSSLWLILSIALLINSNRLARGSPWAHYSWGAIISAMTVADLVATLLYGRDIINITDFDVLSNETGYPITNDETVSEVTFLIAPLIMIVIFSKGFLLWLLNIFFVYKVLIAGQHYAVKGVSQQRLSRNGDNLKESMTDSQTPVHRPMTTANSGVPFSQSFILDDVQRSTIPERSQGMKTINEELTARRQPDPTEIVPQWDRIGDRIGRSHASPRVVRQLTESVSKPSSRQTTPEVILNHKNPSAFSYTQGPPPTQIPRPRQSDSRPRSPDDPESLGSWIESPQSPLWRDPQSDTWWIPSDDGPARRQTQPTRTPVSELRAQLPWSYFQAPLELENTVPESTPPFSKKSSDIPMRKVPIIPAPDYTLHLQRGRHRSSTRDLREMSPGSPEGLARSVSDVGKRLPTGGTKGLRNRNVYGAPFVITDASSPSPHLLRRPTQF